MIYIFKTICNKRDPNHQTLDKEINFTPSFFILIQFDPRPLGQDFSDCPLYVGDFQKENKSEKRVRIPVFTGTSLTHEQPQVASLANRKA